jgi:SAM-dependent methyltransferase
VANERFRRCTAGGPSHIVAGMTTDTLPLCPVAASRGWARVFATMYDPFLWIGERAGMRRHRRALLAQARGQTLEIGSGTGLNLVHYPDNLDGLVLAEPDPSMRQRLQTAMRHSGRDAQVIDARAEQLPFADASVDTVISTFLLCTVDAPETALREIGRVLRPDGQLLFVEHVRSASPLLARWQDRLARPWQRFAVGCRCNRATLELIDACGFRVDARPAAWRAMPPIIRPLAIGRATIGHMISQPDPLLEESRQRSRNPVR